MNAEAAIEPVAILVDADACPVKEEVYRVAARLGAAVYIVSNGHIAVPRDPWIKRIAVPSGPDEADDWIAERARTGIVVVTADIPLADRCVKAGAAVLAPTGRIFDQASIGMAVATRNLMTELRSAGESTGGPRPFSKKDRSAFLSALDRTVRRALSADITPG